MRIFLDLTTKGRLYGLFAEMLPSMRDILSTPRLSNPAVNDTGTKVAWVETTACWEDNKYRRNIRLHDVRTGETLSPTVGNIESFSPAWSVDGKLAWLSPVGKENDKTDQIFLENLGRPVQVSHCKGGVSSFKWDPRGSGLFVIANGPEHEERLKTRAQQYGDFRYVDVDTPWGCLFYLEIDRSFEKFHELHETSDCLPNLSRDRDQGRYLAGAPDQHIIHFDISPDGKRVVYSATSSANPEECDRLRLFLLEIESREWKRIDLGGLLDDYGQNILFSPDGKRIAYNRPINEGRWGNISTLEIMELESGATLRPLLHLDEFIYPKAWTELGLVFNWQQKTDWYVSLLTENREILPLVADAGMVTQEVSVSADGAQLATITATRERCFEVMLGRKPVTDNHQHCGAMIVSNREIVSWKSHDGTRIEGILISSKDTDKSRPRPLLVLVHGGPTEAALAVPQLDFDYPLEEFVKRGFIILAVNFRGSSGYGDKFRNLNYRNLGLGDYEDVISGVDFLVDQGLANKDMVGIMGWSWGGYISAMCATSSDRFKAISVGAGITNWYSYYNSTDIHQFTRHYLGANPWDDPEIYARTSPMTYIKQACTPTLIQHGDQDSRVPTCNALELYQGLRDMGVETSLVLFKGMGHCATKPGLNHAIMKQNYHWFCHYILGDGLNGFWLEDDETRHKTMDRR